MFHLPHPYRSGNFIVDYSILYTCAVLEYVQASGDLEAGRDLYPTALKQFVRSFLSSNGVMLIKLTRTFAFFF